MKQIYRKNSAFKAEYKIDNFIFDIDLENPYIDDNKEYYTDTAAYDIVYGGRFIGWICIGWKHLDSQLVKKDYQIADFYIRSNRQLTIKIMNMLCSHNHLDEFDSIEELLITFVGWMNKYG